MTTAELSGALDAALAFFLGCAAFFLRLFFLGLFLEDAMAAVLSDYEKQTSFPEIILNVSIIVCSNLKHLCSKMDGSRMWDTKFNDYIELVLAQFSLTLSLMKRSPP